MLQTLQRRKKCIGIILSDEHTISQLIISILSFLDIFSIDFAQWKSVGLPHIAYIVIH